MAKVLIIGSGGREHALADKFKQSSYVDEVFVAPGNSGMGDVATIVNIDQLDFQGLIKFAKDKQIDLTFVGPEIPLCAGIVDAFQKENLLIFGPNKKAAQLEGSKAFAKEIMNKYQIPTAEYKTFTNYEKALVYLQQSNYPIVLKCDGLAAGKGVVICEDYQHAKKEITDLMCHKKFNDAGSSVVIEQFLIGEEFSLLAFVHDDLIIPMQMAQDHKKALNNDLGLNTGGMGAYTPCNHLPNWAYDQAVDQIIKPTIKGLKEEGITFTGILYAGCMICDQQVKTIEFNVRFGDPETEVLLLALKSDLYEVIMALLNNELLKLTWSNKTYCGVVIAANGYPETYKKDILLTDIAKMPTKKYFMGVKNNHHNELVSSGGRVLIMCDSGNDLKEAQNNVYKNVLKIEQGDLFYRTDIGSKGIK